MERSWPKRRRACHYLDSLWLKTVGLSSQICEKFGPNLDTCPEGTILGLRLDSSGGLHLHINGVDQGVAVPDVPQPCHALVDLYGQCEQVGANGEGQKGVPGAWKRLLHKGIWDLSVGG